MQPMSYAQVGFECYVDGMKQALSRFHGDISMLAKKSLNSLPFRGQELSPTYYKQVEREVKDAARFGISKDVDPEDFAVKYVHCFSLIYGVVFL